MKPWDLKLGRARYHLADLTTQVDLYLASGAAYTESVHDAATDEYKMVLRLKAAPPDDFCLMVGDILNNARSALDSYTFDCVTTRAKALGKKISKNDIKFPVFKEPNDFAQGRWHGNILTATEVAVFEEFQPFRYSFLPGASAAEIDEEREDHPLRRMQVLSNTDKHQTVHVVACVVESFWLPVEPGMSTQFLPADPSPWLDGDTVARVAIKGMPPDMVPSIGDNMAVRIEGDPWSVLDRMNRIVNEAQTAIAYFDANL